MKIYILFTILTFLIFPGLGAQTPLQAYIDSALTHNIVLQRKNIDLEQARYALRVAKGMFLPTVRLEGQYTTATGGRNIDLPLGDLLNNVYSTLNDLTATNDFPTLHNQSFNLLPTNFYDVKIHTTVPIYDGRLKYNRRIREQKVELTSDDLAIYKRDLIEKVSTAYLNYLQAVDAILIHQSGLELANEGLRVNKRLLEQGKGLQAYLIRSESEVTDARARIAEAQQQADNARRYFNFLLNRDPEAGIRTPDQETDPTDRVLSALGQVPDISGREELDVLEENVRLQENAYQLQKASNQPTVYGFLDLGSQAEQLKFDSQSRYVMLGVQVSVPIYSGNSHRNKLEESRLEIEDARYHQQWVRSQLELNGQVARNNLQTAYQNYRATEKQLEAADTYHRLIERGYRAGTNTYIESVDARNRLTQARLALSINELKMLAALATLDRTVATHIIN